MDVTPVTPEKAKPNTMSRGTARGKLWKVRVQGGRAVYRSLYEKLEKSGAVKKMATTYRDKGGDSDGNGVPSFEVIVGHELVGACFGEPRSEADVQVMTFQ